MASTSEELASQAEQLQSSIDFFKVEDGGNRRPKSIAGLRKISQTAKKAQIAHVAHGQANGYASGKAFTPVDEKTLAGLDLDMDECGDKLDKEFARF